MALQSLNGFDDESKKENKGSEASSLKETQIPSMDSIIRIFEEQLLSEDRSVRLACIKTLLSDQITYAPKQVVDYALSRALFISAYHADIEALKLLLDNRLHVNEPDIINGMNPLTLSMFHQDPECIAFLLGKGANLLTKLGGKETVLEFIMQEASVETMGCILDHSPSLCQDLMDNPSVFDACIEDGRPSNVALLLNHFKQQKVTVNVNPIVLRHIAHHEDAIALRKLCEVGFEIDFHDPSTVEAWYIAIKTGNMDMAEMLIEMGILNHDFDRGKRALQIAIQSERVEMIEQLIDLGVTVNYVTTMGAYPLLLAAETGNPIVFELIMKQQPDLSNHDIDELVEQMNLTMKILHPELIDMRDAQNPMMLDQKGIDYDSQIDPQKLSHISYDDCVSLLKDLLQCEFVPEQSIYAIQKHIRYDINQKIDDHGTLLHFAASKNLIYAIRVLLKLGADINSMNALYAETPLMKAIKCKNKEAAMLLIELGADCEMEDEFHTLPLIEAVERFDMEHRVVIELLRAGVHDHGLIFVADN